MSPESAFADDVLLARLRNGDLAAFEEIYLAQFDSLVSFIYSIVKSADVARDIVQDTFLGLWESKGENVRVSVRTYLYGVARNKAFHALRRHDIDQRARLRSDLEWVQDAESPENSAESSSLEEDVRRLAAGLSERQRAAFELRWVDGLTATEIGHVMGISEAAVRKLLKHVEGKMGELRARWSV